MRILEKLWRPNPKDIASGLVSQMRFVQNFTALSQAATAVTYTAATTCPVNTVRVITLINFSLTPGAGQIASNIGAQLVSSGAAVLGVSLEPPYVKAAAAAWLGHINLVEGVMMRPTDTLNVTGTFSAGGVANGFQIQLYGYDLPIGNVQ